MCSRSFVSPSSFRKSNKTFLFLSFLTVHLLQKFSVKTDQLQFQRITGWISEEMSLSLLGAHRLFAANCPMDVTMSKTQLFCVPPIEIQNLSYAPSALTDIPCR